MTCSPGAQSGSRARTPRTWRARSLAIADLVSLEWLGPWNSGVRVGAEAGVRVVVFEIVGEQPGGWVHDGHVPGLGSFAVDRHDHRVGGADVCDVEVAELLNAGGGVVGEGEQDGVADGTAAGGAGLRRAAP